MDDEVLKMVNEQYARAKQILEEHKEGHNELAELLITREVIYVEDVEKIFGKRPWVSRTQEIIEANEALKAEREKQLAEKLVIDNMPEEVKKAQEEFLKNANDTTQIEGISSQNENTNESGNDSSVAGENLDNKENDKLNENNSESKA